MAQLKRAHELNQLPDGTIYFDATELVKIRPTVGMAPGLRRITDRSLSPIAFQQKSGPVPLDHSVYLTFQDYDVLHAIQFFGRLADTLGLAMLNEPSPRSLIVNHIQVLLDQYPNIAQHAVFVACSKKFHGRFTADYLASVVREEFALMEQASRQAFVSKPETE